MAKPFPDSPGPRDSILRFGSERGPQRDENGLSAPSELDTWQHDCPAEGLQVSESSDLLPSGRTSRVLLV